MYFIVIFMYSYCLYTLFYVFCSTLNEDFPFFFPQL